MIIVNIVLINFGYDIATDVKILSTILLALDCVLIGKYWQRYQLLLLRDAAIDELLRAQRSGNANIAARDSDAG